MVDAGYTKLTNGEWVATSSFNSLSQVEKDKLNAVGIEAFNAWLPSKKMVDAGNTQLKTGEWILTSEYLKLSQVEKDKLNSVGIQEFNAWLPTYRTSLTSTQLSTGEWISTETYNTLTADEKTKLNSIGIAAFNTWYPENKMIQAGNVKIATGEWISSAELSKLDESEKSMLNSVGIEKFNVWYPEHEMIQAGNIKLNTGEWISGEAMTGLTADEKAKLITIGITEFNKWYPEKKLAESGNIKLNNGEWISSVEFNKLNLTEQDKLKELGTSGFNNWYVAQHPELLPPGLRAAPIISNSTSQQRQDIASGKVPAPAGSIVVKDPTSGKTLVWLSGEMPMVGLATTGGGDEYWRYLNTEDGVGIYYWRLANPNYVNMTQEQQALAYNKFGSRAEAVQWLVNHPEKMAGYNSMNIDPQGTYFNAKTGKLGTNVIGIIDPLTQKVADDTITISVQDSIQKMVDLRPDLFTMTKITDSGTGSAKGFTGTDYVRTVSGDIPAWMLVPDTSGAWAPSGGPAMGTSYGVELNNVRFPISSKQEYRLVRWQTGYSFEYPVYELKFKDTSGKIVWSSGAEPGLTPVNWTEETYLAHVGVDKATPGNIIGSWGPSAIGFKNSLFNFF